MKREVIKIGNSLGITLGVHETRANNIVKGDVIEIEIVNVEKRGKKWKKKK